MTINSKNEQLESTGSMRTILAQKIGRNRWIGCIFRSGNKDNKVYLNSFFLKRQHFALNMSHLRHRGE